MSVIKGYLKRAYEISSSWELLHAEISRMKQVLINNGFPNHIVDRDVEIVMNNISTGRKSSRDTTNTIKVYYANQMNNNYKTDEKVIKNIIKNKVTPKDSTTRMELIIYYKNQKTRQLVMKNNLTAEKRQIDKTCAIYHYTCPHDVCKRQTDKNNAYTGYITMTVSRRLSYHKSNGAMAKHSQQKHGRKLNRAELVENTKIRYIMPDRRRLQTLEALLIKYEDP